MKLAKLSIFTIVFFLAHSVLAQKMTRSGAYYYMEKDLIPKNKAHELLKTHDFAMFPYEDYESNKRSARTWGIIGGSTLLLGVITTSIDDDDNLVEEFFEAGAGIILTTAGLVACTVALVKASNTKGKLDRAIDVYNRHSTKDLGCSRIKSFEIDFVARGSGAGLVCRF